MVLKKVGIINEMIKASGLLREGFPLLKSSKLKFQTLPLQKRFILAGLNVCIEGMLLFLIKREILL